MGVREALARYAAARPRPFVVAAADGTPARLAVEAELRRRGWRAAASPAETGLVVVCGEPGAQLTEAVEVVWRDVPGPRARVDLPGGTSPENVARALDGAVERLADLDAQRSDAKARAVVGFWTPESGHEHAGMDHGHSGAGHGQGEMDDEHAGMGHGHAGAGHERAGAGDEHAGMGHEHAGAGHGYAGAGHEHAGMSRERAGTGDGHGHAGAGGQGEGHGGHDMGGHAHHMGAPAGLAMAERGDDRDGLRLDVLHVPLGPVLNAWPAGLRVDLSLQGDVVQAADVTVVERGGGGSFWDGRPVARRLDSVGRLAEVAGWPAAARRAAELRDAVLDGRSPGLDGFARWIGRSWALRWMTRGVGTVTPELAGRYGLPEGDVADRLDGWLAQIDGRAVPRDEPSGAALAVLPELLDGVELGEARLIVASLDPDLSGGADG